MCALLGFLMAYQVSSRIVNERGFSVLELVAVLVIVAIVSVAATIGLKSLNNPLLNAAHQATTFFRQVRARAIATTQAYRITPTSGTRLTTTFGVNCDNTETEDPALFLELPTGASLSDTDWDVCYSTRGVADSNFELAIEDQDGVTRTLEILLGGTVREL